MNILDKSLEGVNGSRFITMMVNRLSREYFRAYNDYAGKLGAIDGATLLGANIETLHILSEHIMKHVIELGFATVSEEARLAMTIEVANEFSRRFKKDTHEA